MFERLFSDPVPAGQMQPEGLANGIHSRGVPFLGCALDGLQRMMQQLVHQAAGEYLDSRRLFRRKTLQLAFQAAMLRLTNLLDRSLQVHDLRHNVERMQPPLVLLDLRRDHRLRKLRLFATLIEV